MFILGCFIYCISYPTRNPIDKQVKRLTICTFLTVGSYAAAIVLQNEKLSLFTFGVFHFLVDTVMFLMLDFVRRFTGIPERKPREKRYLLAAIGIDALLLLINLFVRVMFRVETLYYGKLVHRVADRGIAYYYHLLLVYFMAMVIMAVLARKIISSPRIYKVKYSCILVVMFITLCSHALYMNRSLKFDYSVIFYPVLAFMVCFFSLVYIPRGLLESLLFFTIAGMKDGIICMDIDGRCVYANNTARSFCENGNDLGVVEKQVQTWLEEQEINDSIEKKQWESQRKISGSEHYYNISFQKIYDKGMNYLGCFFFIHDRTDEYSKLEAERYRASHDLLTDIPNRDDFYSRTRARIDADSDRTYFMVCADVKSFKIINDVFGVDAGDRLLKRLAQITKNLAGDKCEYGRLTGDRFVMCMPTERFNEEHILRQYSTVSGFLDEYSKGDELTKGTFKVHVHIGVYEITDRNLRISVMCDRACLAIKSIKDSYENIVAYYDNRMRENYMNEQKVIAEFDEALLGGQFAVYIQPQVGVDGGIRGGEALVRWVHPREGKIPPSLFIPILEHTGLICRLDLHIWETACRILSSWRAAGKTAYYLAVNISQKDFCMIDVYGIITGLCRKYAIPPASLHLEITETAIMDQPDSQLRLIERFRQAGFIIEIDDFGSGYSSLNTLKDMTVDVLKIDMGFLSETGNKERSRTILKMVIALAKTLRLEVITEGVEDKEQVDYLTEYGCDIFQGYYFAKPMPADEFEKNYLGRRFNM